MVTRNHIRLRRVPCVLLAAVVVGRSRPFSIGGAQWNGVARCEIRPRPFRRQSASWLVDAGSRGSGLDAHAPAISKAPGATGADSFPLLRLSPRRGPAGKAWLPVGDRGSEFSCFCGVVRASRGLRCEGRPGWLRALDAGCKFPILSPWFRQILRRHQPIPRFRWRKGHPPPHGPGDVHGL